MVKNYPPQLKDYARALPNGSIDAAGHGPVRETSWAEASGAVRGMPGEAGRRGHAEAVLPFGEIAEKIVAPLSEAAQKL